MRHPNFSELPEMLVKHQCRVGAQMTEAFWELRMFTRNLSFVLLELLCFDQVKHAILRSLAVAVGSFNIFRNL